MPRYTYECTKCGHTYEKLEGWEAEARQRCPLCRAVSQRVPALPAIVFKGSGWYSTDHRRSLRGDGREPDAESDTAESADGESGSGGGEGAEKAGTPASGAGTGGAEADD